MALGSGALLGVPWGPIQRGHCKCVARETQTTHSMEESKNRNRKKPIDHKMQKNMNFFENSHFFENFINSKKPASSPPVAGTEVPPWPRRGPRDGPPGAGEPPAAASLMPPAPPTTASPWGRFQLKKKPERRPPHHPGRRTAKGVTNSCQRENDCD